jgi:beta-1,4-mannosyl-glycoprotein beta-1,4-N-acetylglucosaminyltransferase
MKVIDCFTLFNEMDLLEFRFKLLNCSVDLFVIAESNLTHSGKSKVYNFEMNKERYAEWAHKIHYIKVSQTTEGLVFPENETKYNPENGSWILENQQRNALKKANEFIKDNDLVIIGDLDEIPNPDVLRNLNIGEEPVTLLMQFHYYFMNCRSSKSEKWWGGSVLCKGTTFNMNMPQTFRDGRNSYIKIKKGGWHFSYLGGVEKIKLKISSFAHTEYNKSEFLDDKHIIGSLEKGLDVFNRPGMKYKFVPLTFYPAELRELMLQYPQFVKNISWLTYLKKFIVK